MFPKDETIVSKNDAEYIGKILDRAIKFLEIAKKAGTKIADVDDAMRYACDSIEVLDDFICSVRDRPSRRSVKTSLQLEQDYAVDPR